MTITLRSNRDVVKGSLLSGGGDGSPALDKRLWINSARLKEAVACADDSFLIRLNGAAECYSGRLAGSLPQAPRVQAASSRDLREPGCGSGARRCQRSPHRSAGW